MSAGWGIEPLSAWVAVMAPLVGVPLAAMTFYLRSLRENLVLAQAAIVRRLDADEAMLSELRRCVAEAPREFTSKEEWLRELGQTRQTLERVTAATIRLEATLDALVSRKEVEA